MLLTGYARALHRVQRAGAGPPGPEWRVERGLVVTVPVLLGVGVLLWSLATATDLPVRL